LVYKWRLLPDFESTMGFIPKRHLLLPYTRFYPLSGLTCSQQYHLQGRFAECLYCDVTPPPILHVSSRFIEFTCHMQLYSRTIIYSLYSQTSHIHSYNYTFIHEHFHTLMHTQHKHNTNSHMIALVIQNLVSVVSLQFYLYLSLCQAASF